MSLAPVSKYPCPGLFGGRRVVLQGHPVCNTFSTKPKQSPPALCQAVAQSPTPVRPPQEVSSDDKGLDGIDLMDRSSALSLDNIRGSLVRQEDTIIFSLIERAQFSLNPPVYQEGGVLEFLLRETEQLHGKIRRFTSPDEHPFFPEDVPPIMLRPITYASVLAPFNKEINVNTRVKELYVDHLLPKVAAAGDDNNYGSSAMYDVLALQALSKRVHYGKFVAEAKFLEKREEYSEMIRNQDSDGIMDLLTNRAVEAQVVARVRQKTASFGREYTGDGPLQAAGQEEQFKVQPDAVAALFEDWVMPLTKEVEVLYLLRRLEWDH